MLAVAVGLLVFDALATYVLHGRRRRTRRRVGEAGSMRRPEDVASEADRLNDDLARRQATPQARWRPAPPAVDRSRHEQAVGVPRGVKAPLFEIRRSAERLSATHVLVYDPVVWEA